MYLPYFGQDLESKKKVIGILAHVWSEHKPSTSHLTSRVCYGCGVATLTLCHSNSGAADQHTVSETGVVCLLARHAQLSYLAIAQK